MSDIAFIGDGSLLIRCAAETVQYGHRIRFIVSSNQDVIRWALEKQIATFDDCDAVPGDLLSSTDYTFSIGHLEVIPGKILEQIEGQVINFHDGPLPEYAGLHVTSWALLNGETSHAVTWHEVTGEIDAGDVVATYPFPIRSTDTALSLNLACFEHGARLFLETILPQLSGSRVRTAPQESSPRTLYTRHQKPYAGGVVCWDQTVEAISRTVRALTFGQYDNPVAGAKILIGNRWYVVPAVAATDWQADSVPGTVLSTDGNLAIACADGVLEIEELRTMSGALVPAASVLSRHSISQGDCLPVPDAVRAADLQSQLIEASRTEASFFQKFHTDLVAHIDGFLPVEAGADERETRAWISVRQGSQRDLLQAVLCYLALEQGNHTGCFLVETENSNQSESALAPVAPKIIEVLPEESFTAFIGRMRSLLPVAVDILARRPVLRGAPTSIGVVQSKAALNFCENSFLVVEVDPESGRFRLHAAPAVVPDAVALRLECELSCFLKGVLAAPGQPLRSHGLLDRDALAQTNTFNNTATSVDYRRGLHEHFHDSVVATPDAVAVQYRSESLTYAELDARSEQIAALLIENGVTDGSLVGISLSRSIEMVASILGVLRIGAAYVPLDPKFPKVRLLQMVEDAQLECILIDDSSGSLWSGLEVRGLSVKEARNRARPELLAGLLERRPDALAYTMFTSGSTGRPKGVQITHKNVLNFFAGMDQRLDRPVQGSWLSVTSLSFDISVLELLWSLCRGLRVIVFDHADGIVSAVRSTESPLDFSLSYFASDTGETSTADGYALLFDGAEFADTHGFAAVWTPERHFHSFGGLFPNPAVTSAAIAGRTKNISIRAGSVVAPLHHPIRIAEDWALVDQISGGRAGVSFASGWQENDFVLRPESYEKRKDEMFESLDTVRKLWRGEKLEFSGVGGKPVAVAIKPLPVNPEIPTWITAAGNPETFQAAGEIGANVLTHLLGQSIADLQQKIELYRTARAQAGHSGPGQVTVMVHTFVGEDREAVRSAVHGPLTKYLQTAVGLIREAPYAFPTFKKPSEEIAAKVEQGIRDFSARELEQLTEFAFDRYFESSGLFGTPEDCVRRSLELHAAGADEIACLIDFGVPHQQVLDSFPLLNQVRERSQQAIQSDGYSFTEIVKREAVTHFQSTPSFMELVADSPVSIEALSKIDTILLGGEPLKESLIERIRPFVKGKLFNMYGPTETTIWSSVGAVHESNWRPFLGTPIANTGIYIIDPLGRVVAPGKIGEVYITGDGLAPGYIGRPDLTSERFVSLQLPSGTVRAYRTGDFGRVHSDGRFEFAGRNDGQVKVSGHRIELGEIERALGTITEIEQNVVVVSTQQGMPQLKAYYRANQPLAISVLREALNETLPTFMIPSSFVRLETFPLTPNGKVDRVLLAARKESEVSVENTVEQGTILETVQAVWSKILAGAAVDVDTNIFDLGANSLMVVQAAVQFREILHREVALVDIFSNPTIRGFVAGLEAVSAAGEGGHAAERASKRRAFLARRQSLR